MMMAARGVFRVSHPHIRQSRYLWSLRGVSQSSASNDKPLSLDDWSKGIDPGIYIKKIDKSGEEVPGEIKPEELLIDYYRGRYQSTLFTHLYRILCPS